MGGQSERREESGEGGEESGPRPLLAHHDTRPHAREVYAFALELLHQAGQFSAAVVHCRIGDIGVPDCSEGGREGGEQDVGL